MPRQLRIEYSGAIYHVMNRGDRREMIFEDDFDRQRFVTTLGVKGSVLALQGGEGGFALVWRTIEG